MRCRDAFRLGDGAEGIRLFEELDRSLVGFRDRMYAAESLFEARAFEPARELVNKASSLRPRSPRVLRLKARISGRLMEAEAVGALREWLEDRPGDLVARMELGELLLALGRPEEALARLQPALRKRSRHTGLHSLLGRAYFAAGQPESAKEHLLEAQRLRATAKRQVIPLYDTGMETGYDFRFAVQGRWEEDRDWLLLEQIDGSRRREAPAEFGVIGVDGAKGPAV